MTMQPPCQTLRSDGSLRGFDILAFLSLLGVVSLSFCGCKPSDTENGPIYVLVAASAKEATQEAVGLFCDEQTTADQLQIVVASGPSSGLAHQILNGAPADIFISASHKWTKAVTNENADSSPLLSNRLVLATNDFKSEDVTSVDDLFQDHVKSIAVAGKHVPVGDYADQYIQQLSESQQQSIAPKLVFAKDSSAVVAWLESNEVDAAFVYASDLNRSSQLRFVEQIDESLHSPIVYSIVSFTDENRHPITGKLHDWLKADKAQAIYRAAGFESAESVSVTSE